MKRPLFLVCALVLVTAIGGSAAPVVPADGPGPYAVGFTMFTVVDPDRPAAAGFAGRPISLYVWYPADNSAITLSTPQAVYPLDPVYKPSLVTTSSNWETYGLDRAYEEPPFSSGGPFPLLMFSPGLSSKAWNHIYIGTRLASHGFIVAVISHLEDKTFAWQPAQPHVRIVSVHRPRDVSFAVTKLLERHDTPGDPFYGQIDPQRIAAGGWSLGGYAAMTLAAGDDLVCDNLPQVPPETCVATPADSRIKALVLLDGSNQLLRFYELARVTIPALSMGREWNVVLDWQARQHAAFNGHPNYRIDVPNIVHASFANPCETAHVLGDIGLITPAQVAARLAANCTGLMPAAEVHALVTQYAVAFLKTVLTGETGDQSMLTPGFALRQQTVEFFVTEKRDDHAIDADIPGFFIYFMHQPGSLQAYGLQDPAVMRPLDDTEEP